MKTEDANSAVARFVPLISWLAVVVTLVFIALKIVSYGYVPDGDARRHIAKAFTDKPYTEILVVRPEYTMDHSPGWEWLLRVLQRAQGWNEDALAGFSVAFLLLCIFFAPLPWMRRPEAWLAALLAQMVAIPELMVRFTQARPYLLTEAVLIAILCAWSKPDAKNPSWLKVLLTTAGIALSVWMHGTWYLWVLPLAAFFLAGAWRAGISLAGCWLSGTIAGALLTGKPFVFLKLAISIITLVSREHIPQWMLVGELRPMYGEFSTLLLLAIVFLWRRQQVKGDLGLFRQPLFWMFAICWILGFKADRFWADWGIPAVLVWLAWQFEALMAGAWPAWSPKRLALCALIAAPLFLDATNDLDRRYSHNFEEASLDGSDPALKGWVPGDGGILYSAQMDCFYNTFYANPRADWRYILTIEPALMPEDDLKIYRNIQRSHLAYQAYEPWIARMRPIDRLMILTGGQPNLPRLEWTNAIGNIWIGRPPKVNAK